MRDLIALSAIVLASSGVSIAQDIQGKKVSFHVISVVSSRDPEICNESDAQCSSTRLTVEGYADVWQNPIPIQYVLNCSEILASSPSPHYTGICVHLHAGITYPAEFNGENLSFWGGSWDPSSKPLQQLYGIVSEREKK